MNNKYLHKFYESTALNGSITDTRRRARTVNQYGRVAADIPRRETYI